ncbi:FKBP-type peptidyl-prolyl cis-trans isomerase [Mycetocola spongiae]|uniref:FKBP-type peptidyl-prolyl cis-trans isomerase n=1 Tax=Mycetocola spongiae TaxID=2859226 RepID=UPI001CF5ABAF|nr:FKBP-type peptidyl-prolyl cis-trans isomerase [Mycetocola spongiae]UCR89668.1 FKBP-type peptidyl-prolyl cis-trans isomerase [Mycetocola spongiae]
MRTTPALIVTAVLLAGGLSACSSAPVAQDCEGAPADGKGAQLVQVSAPGAGAPRVSFPTPVIVDGLERHVLVEGDGPVIDANQVVSMSFTVLDGSTGQVVPGYEWAEPAVRLVSELPEPLQPMVACATGGSQVAGVLGNALQGETPGEIHSAVFVAQIDRVLPNRATGKPRAVRESGFPSVVSAADGTPGITIPRSEAPTELKVALLAEGDGPVIGDDTAFAMQFTGASWTERTIFASTWEKGSPMGARLSTLSPGMAEALKGQKLGSRVLMVVPADQDVTAGGAGLGAPAGTTAVYVVDLLGEL